MQTWLCWVQRTDCAAFEISLAGCHLTPRRTLPRRGCRLTITNNSTSGGHEWELH